MSSLAELLTVTPKGLYCEAGGFYVDPWQPVDHAIITHAHSDHARMGSQKYLAAQSGADVLKIRMGHESNLSFQPFGKSLSVNGVKVTFYPAGHILGSAQVKIERNGYSFVVSGDYKRAADATCTPFEPVRCHTFVTESTFGLPIYRWPEPSKVFESINQWWRTNQDSGKASLLLAYSLGKAQRLLSGVDASIGPIFVHGAIDKINAGYRAAGIDLPQTTYVGDADAQETKWSQALIVAPPSALGGPWANRFCRFSVGMASGWMQVRGTRRRRSLDRGFILSDHADWNALIKSIHETEAECVWVTHGFSDVVVRFLNEQGQDARVVETRFTGESLEEDTE